MELWSIAIYLFILSLTRSVAGEQEIFNLTISDLPECGLGCLVHTVPAAGCGVLDTQCQCASQDLAKLTVACMLANCTMADSLQTAKVQASLCKLPNPSQSQTVIVTTAVLFSLALAFLIARLASKNRHSWSLGGDDICMIAALSLCVISVACVVEMSKIGFGKHLCGLQPGALLRILRFFYIAEVVYVVVLSLVKISIVLFYLRIFPTGGFRIATWATLGFIAISGTIIFFLTIFSCRPVAYFWDRDLHGTCLDVNALAYANSATAVAQDLIIITIPLAMLPRLNMSRKKKIAVGLMFAVGSFGCITSIVRLKSLLVFGNSLDPTWDYVPAVQWTTAELATVFICACLPSIRVILRRFFPTLFTHSGRSRETNSYGYSHGASGKSRRGQGWDPVGNSTEASFEEHGLDKITALPPHASKNAVFSVNHTEALPPWKQDKKSRRKPDLEESGRSAPTPPPKDYPSRDQVPWDFDSMFRPPPATHGHRRQRSDNF